jgi:capsular polysaccharide biosynthesis protein
VIIDIDESKILQTKELNSLFKSLVLKNINEDCKILNTDFYLDSFNYFPITKKNESFANLFKREDDNPISHFYTKDFFKNFIDKKSGFKIIKDCVVLGSSPSDNYFSNLIHFLPRIFFINDKKINLVINRNLSNRFRKFVESICMIRGIEISFTFLDEGFYNFNNSIIPAFFNVNKSVKILKFFLEQILMNVKVPEFKSKIYIRREDANYRKILNEADLISKLRKQEFEIINPQHFEILEQMKIFSNAEVIITPHGSNMSNILFCKEGTKIIEISPELNNTYEQNISKRYKNIADNLNLEFQTIIADSVEVVKHSEIATKYIHPKILKNSNYYKNMILKLSEIENYLNNP